MEERVNALEKEISELQKLLYKMSANLDSISKQISMAVSTKEEVIVLKEQQKSTVIKLEKCEEKRTIIENKVSSIENKLAGYWVWITLLAIIIPYIVKIIQW